MKSPLQAITWLAALVIAALALTSPIRALADAAPPSPPQGGSVGSGDETTKVQMISETVLMTITDDHAAVEATFHMRNQGTTEEVMDVRFPLSANDGYGHINQVEDFSAYVDGNLSQVSIVEQPYVAPDCNGCDFGLVPWAAWHVVFPPRQTVTLGVTYAAPPDPGFSPSFVAYGYVLQTGSGWFGPIGEGIVTVRLPYEITTGNARVDDSSHPHPDNYQVMGTDIIWHFEDLEPGFRDNIWFRVMSPSLWRSVQTAERNVQQDPDNLDTHIILAHALTSAIDVDTKHGMLVTTSGNKSLYDRAVAEYQLILQKIPDNSPLVLEYFDLADLAYPHDPAVYCPAYANACRLNPDDERLADRKARAKYECPASQAASAAPDSTREPTPTIPNTEKPLLALTPTSLPIATTSPPTDNETQLGGGWPYIAGTAILALAIGAWLVFRAKSGAR